jgi:organic radical activating enzyme
MKIEEFPTRVVIELTPVCNLSCPMCPRQHVNLKESHMDNALFKRLIMEIKTENKNAVILPFWRGESCVHPDFLSLMSFALDQGLRIHLSTNGHFMDDEYRNIFYRCEFVTFSLHTDKGFSNAQKLIQNRPDWSKATIQGSFVDSEKSVDKYLELSSQDPDLKGFDSIRLYKEHTVNGEFGKSTMPGNNDIRRFCPKLENTFVIGFDGQYSRCNHVWETSPQPNLINNSIKSVWHCQEVRHIRQRYPDEKCFPCDQWTGHTCGETWRKDGQGRLIHQVFGEVENEPT